MPTERDLIILDRQGRNGGLVGHIVVRQLTKGFHAAALVPAAELAAGNVPEIVIIVDIAVGSLDERVAADGVRRGGRRCVGCFGARLGAVEPCEHRVVKCRIVAKIADLVVTRVVTLIEHDIRALVEG